MPRLPSCARTRWQVPVPDLVVAVLAAGASRRLGQPKQLVPLDGEPLLRRQCRCALAAGLGEVVVVLGANEHQHRTVITDLPVEVTVNQEWTEGLASTLRVAVCAAQRRRAALLVLPCDQYRITPGDLRTLRDRWYAAPSIAWMSVSDGYAGPPAILPDQYFEQVLELRGDAGARSVLRAAQAPAVREMVNPRATFDLDSPADLNIAVAWRPTRRDGRSAPRATALGTDARIQTDLRARR